MMRKLGALLNTAVIAVAASLIVPVHAWAQNDFDQSTITIRARVISGNQIAVSSENAAGTADFSGTSSQGNSDLQGQEVSVGQATSDQSDATPQAGGATGQQDGSQQSAAQAEGQGPSSGGSANEGNTSNSADDSTPQASQNETSSSEGETTGQERSAANTAKPQVPSETVSTTISLLVRDAMLVEVFSHNLLRHKELYHGTGAVRHLPLEKVERQAVINIVYVNN